MRYDIINPISFGKIKEKVDTKDLSRELVMLESFYPHVPYWIIQAVYIMKKI